MFVCPPPQPKMATTGACWLPATTRWRPRLQDTWASSRRWPSRTAPPPGYEQPSPIVNHTRKAWRECIAHKSKYIVNHNPFSTLCKSLNVKFYFKVESKWSACAVVELNKNWKRSSTLHSLNIWVSIFFLPLEGVPYFPNDLKLSLGSLLFLNKICICLT